MRQTFEILEHTADIGVRAYGSTLAEAFEQAARGMLSIMVEPATVRAVEEERIEVTGADAVDLLVTWLMEILYRFDARRRVFADVHVDETGEWRLAGRLAGEPLDRQRHELRTEVKAVTYHHAQVEKTDGGWVVQVIFDI